MDILPILCIVTLLLLAIPTTALIGCFIEKMNTPIMAYEEWW